jgi:hypothetical protein
MSVVIRYIEVSRGSISHIYGISVFGKRLSRKSDNVVVFPSVFHIAVQQPFKPLWLRLLLYELKPSGASFAMCFKSLQMTLLPASVLISQFVWRLLFDLSSKGGPASSYTTAGIALRVTDVLKPPHHDKVETPTRRTKQISDVNNNNIPDRIEVRAIGANDTTMYI